VEITPALLTAIAGLATAIAALVKAIRGDARRLDDLSPSSDVGDVDPSATGNTGPGAGGVTPAPSSANRPEGDAS
jgi:hypothetical protein